MVPLHAALAPDVEEIRSYATHLGADGDLAPLLDRIGGARHVLLGKPSHGTSEHRRPAATSRPAGSLRSRSPVAS